MAEMFVTGLLNTDYFRVLETGAIEVLQEEQALLGEEAQGQMGGADLLVTCAVTSVEPNAGGVGGGLLNVAGAVFGGGGGGIKKATVTLDIRLVDVKTVRSSRPSRPTGRRLTLPGWALSGMVQRWEPSVRSRTLRIKGAVRKAILKASEHLALNTPREYFGAEK